MNTICATLIIYNVQQYQYFKCLTMSMFQHSNAMISTAQYQKCHSNFYGTGVWEKILPRKKTAFLNFQNCHFFTLTGHFWLERHVFISAFDDSDSINKGIRDAGSTADFRILFEIFEILEKFDFFETLNFLIFLIFF